MNILILSWRGPGHPNAGGAEIATHEHAKAWVKAGHKVTLFTSNFDKGKRNENMDGVEIVRMGNQLLTVHIIAFFWYFFGKHPKYDIVVDQFHGIPFFTPIYVKSKKLAFIHEVAAEVWGKNEYKGLLNIFTAKLGPPIEPLIYKLYGNVDFLTVSNSTKDDLIKFGIKKQRINIIENGVYKMKVKAGKREKELTFLGALSKDKGAEDAVKILSEVLRKDEGWKLNIVGKGGSEYLRYIKRLTKDLEVENDVEFYGFVTDKKKFEILARSFCLINPSVHEGWGLVNIEANSVGTPVFAYKVKGIMDSVIDGKTGILADMGDIHQLAMEIIKLSNDKKRYEYISKECLKWGSKYSWEKSTKESTQLIESL